MGRDMPGADGSTVVTQPAPFGDVAQRRALCPAPSLPWPRLRLPVVSINSCELSTWLEMMGVMHLLHLKLKFALNLPVLFPVSSHRSSLLLRK